MTRRIDDIDMYAFVIDRAVLGKDGDTALALDIVRIHHPVCNVLVRGKEPA